MSVTRSPLRNEALRRDEEARGFIADPPSAGTTILMIYAVSGVLVFGSLAMAVAMVMKP